MYLLKNVKSSQLRRDVWDDILPIKPETLAQTTERMRTDGYNEAYPIQAVLIPKGTHELHDNKKLTVTKDTYVVFDGHTRMKAWVDNLGNKEVPFVQIFSIEERPTEIMKYHILQMQTDRRNLTKEEMEYNLAMLAECEKNITEFAKKHGKSRSQIYEIMNFKKGVDKLTPDEKEKVLQGRSDKTKKELQDLGRGKASENRTVKPDSEINRLVKILLNSKDKTGDQWATIWEAVKQGVE